MRRLIYALLQIPIDCGFTDQGPDFRKMFRQSYDFRAIYADLKTNLRHYDNRMNTLNILNITKHINVNIKTSLIYVISRNRQQVCNAM